MSAFDDFDDSEEIAHINRMIAKSKRNNVEFKIHVAIVKHHEKTFPHVKLVHIPNQTKDAQEGFFKKMMGAVPGAHDFAIFWGPPLGVGIYDVKRPGERLSTPQNKFASALQYMGVKCSYGSSVRHYHETLKSWGLVPLSDCVIEPDLATKDEKFKRAHEAYGEFKCTPS